jgi:hypothetical protein
MLSKTTLFLSLLCFFNLTFGQFEYGVKAGIHLNASGTITDAPSDLASVADIKENMTGYFIGSYVALDLAFLYLRPELQFSYLNMNFDSLVLSQSRLEAPISLGFKVLPILSAFAGPTLQYNFDPTIKEVKFTAIEQNTTVGVHLGVRAHLGPLNADVRFDRGISPNELTLLEQNGIPISGRIDTRSNTWSLGLSYRF